VTGGTTPKIARAQPSHFSPTYAAVPKNPPSPLFSVPIFELYFSLILNPFPAQNPLRPLSSLAFMLSVN